MLDGNVLLRQKRDEVPKGTLSCPNRNMANSQRHCHNEGVRLLPSTCDCELIQQTLIIGGVVNNNDEQKLFENYFNNQNPPVPIHFKIIIQN